MFKKALLSGALALYAVASPAQASTPLALTMPGALPLAAVGMAQVNCAMQPAATASPLSYGYASRPMSKSAAILGGQRSEEHTSELQSLMRISYAVFCLKKKKKIRSQTEQTLIHKTQIETPIETK